MLQLILGPVLDPFSGGVNVKSISEALLRRFRRFGAIVNSPVDKLLTIDGMSETAAAALRTVGVAARHLVPEAVRNRPLLCTSDSVKEYLSARFLYEPIEVFLILYLDGGHRLIDVEELRRGRIDRVSAFPREILQRCLGFDAAAIIIAHNRPGGNLEANYQDIEVAENIIAAASVFGIAVIDHIIVGGSKNVSMRERGLI